MMVKLNGCLPTKKVGYESLVVPILNWLKIQIVLKTSQFVEVCVLDNLAYDNYRAKSYLPFLNLIFLVKSFSEN